MSAATKPILPASSSRECAGDDFSGPVSRCAPLPIQGAGELVARFNRLSRQRATWRNCDQCGAHIQEPAHICDVCRDWSLLLIYIERMRSSVRART